MLLWRKTKDTNAIRNPFDTDSSRDRKSEALPPAPSTPPPSGERKPGGGLGEEAVCPEKDEDLTAITPVSVYGKTQLDRPTLWFYMPYTAAEVPKGEFSILTGDDTDWVYGTEFELPDQPGLVSITVPPEAMVNLEVGQRYHWYLQLFCASDPMAKGNININGWVDRVAATAQQTTGGAPEFWYDDLHEVLDQMLMDPSGEMEQVWDELLELVDLEPLREMPIVGPLELIEEES